jgi:hypothetical protein
MKCLLRMRFCVTAVHRCPLNPLCGYRLFLSAAWELIGLMVRIDLLSSQIDDGVKQFPDSGQGMDEAERCCQTSPWK